MVLETYAEHLPPVRTHSLRSFYKWNHVFVKISTFIITAPSFYVNMFSAVISAPLLCGDVDLRRRAIDEIFNCRVFKKQQMLCSAN